MTGIISTSLLMKDRILMRQRSTNCTTLLSRLIDQYRNNGYLYSQICILTVKKESASLLNGVEKIGNHSISSTRSNKGVLFTTARKFKGLEADVIIIIDVDEATFADPENRRLFYVGSSRAKHFLDIAYVGEDESLKRLVSAMSDERYPTPVIGLARSLDVKPVKA
jgi:superfamily I DNA/RNA helicase